MAQNRAIFTQTSFTAVVSFEFRVFDSRKQALGFMADAGISS